MADKQPTPDELAKQMGFPNAATYLAWQARQQQIQHLPAQTMAPAQQQAAPPPKSMTQQFLDSIMQYLPLGSVNKAGNAMSGKK